MSLPPHTPSDAPVEPASILVVIPTLNEAAHIAGTLEDMVVGRPEMEQVKIVVCDGGSTDGTCEIVTEIAGRMPNIHLLANPERLQSAAVNRAVDMLAEPRHSILVRVDAHSHYPPGYVLDVAQSLMRQGASGLATVMDSLGDSCFQRGAAWAMETKLGSGGSGHRGGKVSGWVDHGHHAGFRLEVFRAVGGYDTGFVANEDAELDHRIGMAGGAIWLDATIRLGYVMRPTPGRLALQYWRYGRGRAQTVLKHNMRLRMRQMIPPAAFLAVSFAVLLALAWPPALVVPAAYLGVIGVATLSALQAKRSLCALWVGPALAVMHMVWGAGFVREIAFRKLGGHP